MLLDIDLSSEYAKNIKQFPGVDIAKFVCAILVVAIHTRPLADVNAYANYFLTNFLCRIAVPAFFAWGGVFLL